MVERDSEDAWEAALRQPDRLLRGADVPTFTSRLETWVADARVDEAARQRSRERWMRDVAEQEATLLGVLLDLAERWASVAVTASGHRLNGVVTATGADFVAVRQATGSEVLLALGAISQVRAGRGGDPAVGDRMVTSELLLVDVLTQLAADRERVRLVTRDGEAITGVLRNVGHDVAVLRSDGDPPATSYIPARAITEVTLG